MELTGVEHDARDTEPWTKDLDTAFYVALFLRAAQLSMAVVVQRFGEIVQWSDWEVPWEGHRAMSYPPPELHFDAGQYDAEVARAETDRWWQVYS